MNRLFCVTILSCLALTKFGHILQFALRSCRCQVPAFHASSLSFGKLSFDLTDHLQLLVKHFSVYSDRLGKASYLSLFLHDWQRVEAKEVKET